MARPYTAERGLASVQVSLVFDHSRGAAAYFGESTGPSADEVIT